MAQLVGAEAIYMSIQMSIFSREIFFPRATQEWVAQVGTRGSCASPPPFLSIFSRASQELVSELVGAETSQMLMRFPPPFSHLFFLARRRNGWRNSWGLGLVAASELLVQIL